MGLVPYDSFESKKSEQASPLCLRGGGLANAKPVGIEKTNFIHYLMRILSKPLSDEGGGKSRRLLTEGENEKQLIYCQSGIFIVNNKRDDVGIVPYDK